MGQTIKSVLTPQDMQAISMLHCGVPVTFTELAAVYDCDVWQVSERVNRIAILCDLSLTYQPNFVGHA